VTQIDKAWLFSLRFIPDDREIVAFEESFLLENDWYAHSITEAIKIASLLRVNMQMR
jgi:hypothetical protein